MRGKLFVSNFLLLFYLVSGDRYDILSEDSESWISDQDFRTIVDLSFPYSVCCNIFLADPIETVEVLFAQFRKMYPHVYYVRRRNPECQGYFLLGSTESQISEAMQKVPVSISTTEILIILNAEIDTNLSIFNTSLYKYANANLVSVSGIWSLSENYKKPRFFERVQRYEQLVHHNDLYDLQGRELQICSFYRPPVSYLNRTVNKTINGEEVEVFLVDDETELDGIELKLFLLIAEKLNFTWTIRKPMGPYKYGRRVSKTEWKGGIGEMLMEGKVDIAFASLWLTEDQNAFINLTENWYQLFIRFLVPRPQRTTRFWALTRPFKIKAWLLLITTLFLKSFYVVIRAWIDPEFPKRFRNFVIAITEMTGRLLGTILNDNISRIRVQMVLWHIAGWLTMAAYSSSLAARLASPDFEPRIDTMEQFVEANLSWGREGQSPNFGQFFDLSNPLYMKVKQKFIHVKNQEHTNQLSRSRNFAIFGTIIGSNFFPEDNIPNDSLKHYRLMKEVVQSFYSAFAVQTWLVRPVNRIMLMLRETGIVSYHIRDVIRRRTHYNLREVLVEHDGFDGNAKILGIIPLASGFFLLLIGLTLSTIVFYFELWHASRGSSITEILQEIKRNRQVPQFRRNVKLTRNISELKHKLKRGTLNLTDF